MAEAYLNIDKQTLDLIKYPPLYSPIVSYGSDYTYSSNKLRGKLFQFCYRYLYDTKMKSVFSPYSEVPIPQGEELPNGDFVPDFHLNNYISVKLLVGHHTVDEIEVAYRVGNEGNLYIFDRIKVVHTIQQITGTLNQGSNVMDNIGDWGGVLINDLRVGMILNYKAEVSEIFPFITSIDATNNSITLSKIVDISYPTYNIILGLWHIDEDNVMTVFRNDTVDYPVPTEEAIESFDGVPLTARAMEIIESNRIVAGGPKTGFDNTELNVEVIISHAEKAEYLSKFDFEKEFAYLGSGVKRVYIVIPNTLSIGQFFYVNIKFTDLSDNQIDISVSYYVANSTTTSEDIANYFIEKLNIYNPVSGLKNFEVKSIYTHLNADYGFYQYSSGKTYNTAGDPTIYNNRVFVSKSPTHNHTPPSSATDNDWWKFMCLWADAKESILVYTQPSANDFTGNPYTLLSYGASIYTTQQTYSIFKYGHKVNIGIEYADYAGRLSAANISNQMAVDIPYIDGLPSLYSFNNLTNTITLKIKNTPPIWAYAYRILIDRNIPWFFQFFFYGPAHANPDITDDNIHWRINVNRAIQNLRDFVPKATLSPYIFEKGDRIRLIAYKEQYHIGQSTNRWQKYIDSMDVEIIGYDYPLESETYMKDAGNGTPGTETYILDSNGNKIREVSTGYIITEKFNAPDSSTIPFNDSVYILYEIYRPRKVSDENTSYWETSKTYAIGHPGQEDRFHEGDIEQILPVEDNPAEITLNGGNVYRKMRYSGEADIYFPVESLSLSDFYESNAISVGRSNAVSEDLGQVDEENAYMWSDVLLEDTAINRLNKFPSGNKDRLQSKHGAISALKEKGFILYAWQTNKVTSIYIGRSSMVDPSDGSERVNLISKAVFGTVRPANSEYGCVDPKSISDSQVHVYFKDSNNSKWLRIAYNGVFPISDYGQSKFFNDLNELMNQTSNRHSISVYDNKHDELVVSEKYMAATDYTLSVVGQYVIGDNKLTGIGRTGGDVIADLEEGMILTQLTSAEVTPEINLSILKIDIPNRIIYLDQVIPFGVGIAGPVEITAQILKKNIYKTIAFHESVNGWKTRYPFPPELMVAYGDQMLSFLNGRAYLHDSNLVPYNYFYGIQFDQFIQFVFSADPNMIKLFNGIEILADHKFGMEEKGDVTIKSYDNRGVDMQSKLPMVKLIRNVEGKYVASFLRDMNTPGGENEVYKLVNGRFLRGQTIVLKLSNFEVTKVVLFEVGLYFTQSL